MKDYDGARFVRKAILLSSMITGSPFQEQWVNDGECPPANRRDVLPESQQDVAITPACYEQAANGEQTTALNTPTQALPGIEYLNISTRLEWESAPYSINFMEGPGNYTNILTQDLCPNDPIIHMTLTASPSMQDLMDNILAHDSISMRCLVPSIPGLPTLADALPGLEEPLII